MTDPGSIELLDTRQAAARLGIQPNTLEMWRSAGRYGLPYLKVGRVVRYRARDLDAWLDERVRHSTGEQPNPPRAPKGGRAALKPRG